MKISWSYWLMLMITLFPLPVNAGMVLGLSMGAESAREDMADEFTHIVPIKCLSISNFDVYLKCRQPSAKVFIEYQHIKIEDFIKNEFNEIQKIKAFSCGEKHAN